MVVPHVVVSLGLDGGEDQESGSSGGGSERSTCCVVLKVSMCTAQTCVT